MNKIFRFTRDNRAAVLAGLAVAASPAFAALDVSSGITEIEGAATAAGTVFLAMLAFVVAKYGARKIIGLFGR